MATKTRKPKPVNFIRVSVKLYKSDDEWIKANVPKDSRYKYLRGLIHQIIAEAMDAGLSEVRVRLETRIAERDKPEATADPVQTRIHKDYYNWLTEHVLEYPFTAWLRPRIHQVILKLKESEGVA